MVVDPGQEKVPAEDIQAQTIRLNMVHGADIGSVKRNKLPGVKTLKNRKLTATKMTINKLSGAKTATTKRTTSKIMMNKKSTKRNPISGRSYLSPTLNNNNNEKQVSPNKRTKLHRDTNASKKSNVNEKEMRVHGQSGRLHVHTDHNVTAVHSQSGKLEIYIKNPDHHLDAEEHAAENHSKVTVEVIASEAYKKNNLMKSANIDNNRTKNIKGALTLHIADITGVKKSNVIPKRLEHKLH